MSSTNSLKQSASVEIGLLKALFLATRPKTWPASLSPVILGLAYSYSVSREIYWPVAIVTLLCALALQISSNLINDYFDYKSGVDKSDRLGPMRMCSAGLVSPNQMKQAIVVAMSFALLLGISLMNNGGLPIIIIGIASLLGAYLYTGGPYPLSHLALGEVAAFIFFGPVAVWGTHFLQTKDYNLAAAIVGLIPGLFSAAIMGVNNLRDRASDSASKKMTVMTLLSERGASLLSATLMVAPLFVMLILSVKDHRAYIFGVVALIKIRPNILFVLNEKLDARMNEVLANTGKALFLSTIAISLGLIFL